MKRILGFLWICGFSLLGRLHAAEPAAPLVMMSPYEVSANSIDFKKWIKLRTPHYIVYSDASQKEVSRVMQQLERTYAAAQMFFAREMMNTPPAIIVLPTSNSDWKKIASKGSVEWKVAVSQPAGAFGRLTLVEYDWQGKGSSMLFSSEGAGLVRGMNLDGPFWFGRGVGTFFETVEFEGEEVKLGMQNVRTLHLSAGGWMSWPKFFGLTESSPEFTKDGDTVFQIEGQASAFVQFMLSNSDPGWVDRMLQWAAMMKAGREPTEEAFKDVFGHTWKSWQAKMTDFMDGGRYMVRSIRVPKAYLDIVPAPVELPLAEIRELFILSQILNQKLPASETSLDALLAKGLKTESLRPLLVEACIDRNRPEAAREQMRQLIEAEIPIASLYAQRAEDLFDERISKPFLHATLPTALAVEIHELCEKALRIAPRSPEANNLLAWVEALGPSVTEDSVSAIERVYRRIDGHCSTSEVVIALAIAQWRLGQKADARATAQALLDSPYGGTKAKILALDLIVEIGK